MIREKGIDKLYLSSFLVVNIDVYKKIYYKKIDKKEKIITSSLKI